MITNNNINQKTETFRIEEENKKCYNDIYELLNTI